jgi:E3 ubiquitin-protein ligase TRAF7
VFQCPQDKIVIRSEDLTILIPNLVVAESISNLKIFCKYGCKKENNEWKKDSQGCKEIITVGLRKQHEDECLFALIKCPYNEQCPPIRRMDVDSHLKHCINIPCAHKKVGCTFVGTKQAVDIHIKTCPYETIKDYIVQNSRKMSKLKKKLKEKEDDNKHLQSLVQQLCTTVETLTENIDAKSGKARLNYYLCSHPAPQLNSKTLSDN